MKIRLNLFKETKADQCNNSGSAMPVFTFIDTIKEEQKESMGPGGKMPFGGYITQLSI